MVSALNIATIVRKYFKSNNFLFFFHFKQNEREFFARLQSLDCGVYLYEDRDLQQQALNLLPVSELKQRAKEASKNSRENGQDGVDERDCLLLEVLRWFGMMLIFFFFFKTLTFVTQDRLVESVQC